MMTGLRFKAQRHAQPLRLERTARRSRKVSPLAIFQAVRALRSHRSEHVLARRRADAADAASTLRLQSATPRSPLTGPTDNIGNARTQVVALVAAGRREPAQGARLHCAAGQAITGSQRTVPLIDRFSVSTVGPLAGSLAVPLGADVDTGLRQGHRGSPGRFTFPAWWPASSSASKVNLLKL
jgi:hypothetical protein